MEWMDWARRKKSNDAIKTIAQVGVGIFFFSPLLFQKSQWKLEKCLLIILIEATLIFKHHNPLFTFPKCSALSELLRSSHKDTPFVSDSVLKVRRGPCWEVMSFCPGH